MEHVDLGEIKIPKYYHNFTQEEKKLVCDKIIDTLLEHIDEHLEPDEDRIEFLNMVFKSTLITNEMEENYEVCQVIRDAQNRLNEA